MDHGRVGRDLILRGDTLMKFLGLRQWADEDGATAVEYGIMVALIAVAIIGTVAILGGTLNNMFEHELLREVFGY
jgi:Flp pilus assembly pilin Flp